MSKEQSILIVGIDRAVNEKDNSAAVLNLYYNGTNHIIYQTEDKEEVEALDEITRMGYKKQEILSKVEEQEKEKAGLRKVLDILRPNLRLVGRYLQARMCIFSLLNMDRWIIVKEIPDGEELELLKRYLNNE